MKTPSPRLRYRASAKERSSGCRRPAAYDRCICDGAKGSAGLARSGLKTIRRMVFCSPLIPCCLGQENLVLRQIRHGASEPLFLCVKFLRSFELIPADAAILLAPAARGRNRHAGLPHRICDRNALPLQHFNLPKLQHDVFGYISLRGDLCSL